MKKLIPYLGFSALALTLSLVNPDPSHALLCGLLPCGDHNPPSAPEIDPSALGSAIALVIGGAAMIGDRFRR
jgi:hypothetical protein